MRKKTENKFLEKMKRRNETQNKVMKKKQQQHWN